MGSREDTSRVGHETSSGMYYELLGPAGAARPPLLFIHGGGATGACFRATPDGRVGWADRLAARSYECWLTDWPGTGRSGNRDPLGIEYGDVVEGYLRLLSDVIARPAVVVCHSMGGAVAWQLVEKATQLVAGVVDGMPGVTDPQGFRGKPIRLLTGGEDPAHTRAIEERTVATLREWGADAELTWLPDLGIEGNGHFMFFEENSDELVDVLVDQ